jgi:hypothetical protein
MLLKFLFAILSFTTTTICFFSYAHAQGQEPVLPLPDYAPSAAESTPTLNMHAGGYLWYYRPQQSWVDEYFDLWYGYLVLDSTYEDFGVRLEGRVSDQPFADYYVSNVWFQESYGYYRQPSYIIKLGKSYSHFGRFWDGSLYGNVLSFDGLKLSPDNGVSIEGKFPDLKYMKTNYYFQYYVQDGGTNDSLDGAHSGAPITDTAYNRTGRDTLTIDGGKRRNEVIARLEPTFPILGGELTAGVSYMYVLADLTTLPPPPGAPANIVPGRFNVHRYAYDLEYKRGPFSVFVEFDHQHGQTVVDFPYVLDPSTKISYWWAGAKYKTGKWTWYYNYSEGIYYPQNLHNITQVPGFIYDIRKYIQFIFEYGYMYRMQTGSFYLNDNSLNFYLKASL